eukprot:PhF_6_TR24836/c0_g1_i1/m.34251/K14570/REX1, REXO1, RNH70; RNA exonuclease 1
MGKKKNKQSQQTTDPEATTTTGETTSVAAATQNADILQRLYANASPKLTMLLRETRRTNVGLYDVCKAVVWLLCDDAEPVKWLSVQYRPLLKGVCVIAVDGLTEEAFWACPEICAVMREPQWSHAQLRVPKFSDENSLWEFFMNRVEPPPLPKPKLKSLTEGEAAVLQSIEIVPPKKSEKRPRATEDNAEDNEEIDITTVDPRTLPFPCETFLATPEEIALNNFYPPTASSSYVETKPWRECVGGAGEGGEGGGGEIPYPVVAMDCEMCITALGSELTRVSLVDAYTLKSIYDALVKPPNPILNYLTCYSGITEELLHNVTTTLEDVRQEILSKYIFAETIVVGHSLENDVQALKIRHGKFCDTSIMYPHPAGHPRKHALKYVTRKYLDKFIQQDKQAGHCSIEDATACVELLRLKQLYGKEFGNERTPRESIVTTLERSAKVKCHLIDRVENIKSYVAGNTDFVSVMEDDLAVNRAVNVLNSHAPTTSKDSLSTALQAEQPPAGFVWVHLTSTPREEMNAKIEKLYEAVPPYYCVVVLGLKEGATTPAAAPLPESTMNPSYGLFSIRIKS